MDSLSGDLTWWRHVSSAADLCNKAGFGPTTASFVTNTIASLGGSTNEKAILKCAILSLTEMFFDTEIPRALTTARHEKPDDFVNAWRVLRCKYDERFPTTSSQREARDLVKSLFTVQYNDPHQFSTAAAAFGRIEKSDAKGGHASQGVLSTLLGQHARFSAMNGKYLAPYSTIVGPSGIGKSFSVRQMAVRYGVYVAYSNLAPRNSLGFPRPITMGETPIGAFQGHEEELWEIYLANQITIAKCCKEVGITAAGLFELLTGSTKEVAALRQKLEGLFITTLVDVSTVHNMLDQLKASLEALGLNSPPISPLEDKTQPVIICFDEARALLDDGTNSAFRSLRRAAKSIVEGNDEKETKEAKAPFFIVLLDTTSRISNFTPPDRYDQSAKVLRVGVFHPIYKIDTFNLFTPSAASLEEPTGTTNAMKQLFSHGRPLWGAHLEAGMSWPLLLRFATEKISAQKDRLAYDLSLLTYRMNFYICSPILAEAMVASSMRYLISISPDRNSLVTTQPSEPVLALAASCLLQDPSVRLSCVRSWIRGLHSGAVNPGDIGEQVASLLLLFASDYASEPFRSLPDEDVDVAQDAVPARAVALQSVLIALLGKDAWEEVQSLDHDPETQHILDSGLVFFNHFIRLSASPTIDVLEAVYKRGAALFLPGNFPGMDMAVPVRVSNGRMSLLLLQIKNRQNDSLTPGLKLYMKEALQNAEKALGLSDTLYGIIGIVMCLRTSGDPHFATIVPPVRQTARETRRKAKGKALHSGKVASSVSPSPPAQRKRVAMKKGKATASMPAQLLGIVFGLHTSVYPCMKAPSASAIQMVDGEERGPRELEELCALLARLLERWPNAYADEDLRSTYAQKLLDPVTDIQESDQKDGSGDILMPDSEPHARSQ